MEAPTQRSVTSLSKYAAARTPGEDPYNGSTSRDFCNSFWGVGDSGVNILLARMRGAHRTTDELRNFWRERSIIEDEYASRLSKLAKVTLGRDEIGDMSECLKTLRNETENQAVAHHDLAAQIRAEFEEETSRLLAKQAEHKRALQSSIEKKFKAKQAQEAYVAKSREKYESDYLRIASYTQQSQYTTGPALERLQARLQRAQQTVQANERDFANFTLTLGEITREWEDEWKAFCDTCQDLEDERLEFVWESLWAYANCVATLCVSDDQGCEKIRTSLEQLEPKKAVEDFVNEYGTGNAIPDPPVFVPHDGQQSTQSTIHVTVRPANFVRVSQRPPRPSPFQAAEDQQHQQHHPEIIAQTLPTQTSGRSREPASPQSQSGSIAGTWSDNHSQRSVPQPSPVPASHAPPYTHQPQSQSQSHSQPRGDTGEPSSPARQNSQHGHGHEHARAPSYSHQAQQWGAIGEASSQHTRQAPRNGHGQGQSQGRGYGSGPSPPNQAGNGHGPLSRAPTQRQPLPMPSGTQQEEPRPQSPPPHEVGPGGILFYVKALYDYTTTQEEEFDFQEGDVIAVTATPETGWWIGELLDEARREEGRNVFPSNFVCLF